MGAPDYVSYQYAVRELGSSRYPYARSISELGYFGIYGENVNEALLFESATKAEQAIARRNAFFGSSEQFLVVPVKVITATVTTTTRELV